MTMSMTMTTQDPVVTIISKDRCRYCDYAKDLLWSHGVRFEEVNLSRLYGESVAAMRQHLAELGTGSETVPQLFVNGVYEGGYTAFAKKVRSGELRIAPRDSRNALLA